MAASARGPIGAWLIAALVALAVAFALRESFLGMAFQWRSSSTFSYGFLVLPISLYLLWRERGRLATVPPEPGWPALLCMAPVAGLWLLGTVLDVNVVQHFAAVLLVVLAVWAVLGTPAARVIWFPLAYLLLMVPFGEFLVPTLMRWTADFAVLAVALSGVPVFQDGYVFSLPSGDFEVIKACSGIRFLMATVAAGTVFAWVAYRSWRKRLLFLLACLVVPVLGNLLRAYLVVMLVHLSDGRLAGDHVLYGTLFFAAILLAMFVAGARYADGAPPLPAGRQPVPAGAGAGAALATAGMVWLLALGLAALPGAIRDRAAGAAAQPLPPLPASLAGFGTPGAAATDWKPDLRGAAVESAARYQPVMAADPVDLFVGAFDRAAGSGELTDGRNVPFRERDWRRVGGSDAAGYDDVVLKPSPRSAAAEGSARVVWSWYVVNGEATDSRLGAKLLELKALVGGAQGRQAFVALSTPFEGKPDEARRRLRAFAEAFCAGATLACPGDLRAGPTTPE